jgi:IS5 family transposase
VLAADERRVLDADTDFRAKNGRVHYGYKLHVGVDRETGLMTHHGMTAASVHDSQRRACTSRHTDHGVTAASVHDSRVLADLVDGRASEW